VGVNSLLNVKQISGTAWFRRLLNASMIARTAYPARYRASIAAPAPITAAKSIFLVSSL